MRSMHLDAPILSPCQLVFASVHDNGEAWCASEGMGVGLGTRQPQSRDQLARRTLSVYTRSPASFR